MQLADAAYQERDRLVINHLSLVKKVRWGWFGGCLHRWR
jgi:hypothetical protein